MGEVGNYQKYQMLFLADECHPHMVEVTGSNPTGPTKPVTTGSLIISLTPLFPAVFLLYFVSNNIDPELRNP
jgi:hypothetical protein